MKKKSKKKTTLWLCLFNTPDLETVEYMCIVALLTAFPRIAIKSGSAFDNTSGQGYHGQIHTRKQGTQANEVNRTAGKENQNQKRHMVLCKSFKSFSRRWQQICPSEHGF